MIIAFVGPNGSGKTTASREVTKILGEKSLYVRGGDYFILNYAGKLLSKILKRRKTPSLLDSSNENKTNSFADLISIFAFFDCFVLFFFLNIISQFRIVVMDRYFYDIAIANRLRNCKLGYSLFSLFPKPPLIFFLSVDPKIAYQRRVKERNFPFDKYRLMDLYYRDLVAIKKIPVIENKNLDNVVNKVIGLL